MEIWEQHPSIYHYTNQQGLEGILHSQSLHATHYKHLNDEGEVEFARPKLVESIKPHIARIIDSAQQESSRVRQHVVRSGGLDPFVSVGAEAIVKTLYQVTFGDEERDAFVLPFIISFCAHTTSYEQGNGLLSQWRAYGQNSGYALEFDTNKLWQAMQSEEDIYSYGGTLLDAVEYDIDQEHFDTHFAKLIEKMSAAYRDIHFSDAPDISPLFGPFIHGVTRYKHRGFTEENEVRAVMYPQSSSWLQKLERESPEEFRKMPNRAVKQVLHKSGMRPYLVIGDGKNALPITRIIVGPHRDKQRRADVLRRFLKARSMECPVQISETPLV
jgi:hypothetical protein